MNRCLGGSVPEIFAGKWNELTKRLLLVCLLLAMVGRRACSCDLSVYCIYLPTYFSICLSMYLPTYQSTCIPPYPSIHPSIPSFLDWLIDWLIPSFMYLVIELNSLPCIRSTIGMKVFSQMFTLKRSTHRSHVISCSESHCGDGKRFTTSSSCWAHDSWESKEKTKQWEDCDPWKFSTYILYISTISSNIIRRVASNKTWYYPSSSFKKRQQKDQNKYIHAKSCF